MKPGKIHDTQLRVSAAMAAAGKGEDEIVAALLRPAHQAAGQGAPLELDQGGESLRAMIQGAAQEVRR